MRLLQRSLIHRSSPPAGGGGPPASFTTWNPSDRDDDLTLSDGNRTVAMPWFGGVRSVASKASGIWYWEIRVDANGVNAPVMGIANASFDTSTYPGNDLHSIGAYPYGSTAEILVRAASVASALGPIGPSGVGDIYSFLLNLGTRQVSFFRNGVIAHTAAMAGSLATGAVFAAVGRATGSHQVTANFGASAWAYPGIPAGAGASGLTE